MARGLQLVLLLIVTVGSAVRAQEPGGARPALPPRDVGGLAARPVGTGSISGIVTSADTGTPLRRVNVTLQLLTGSGGMPLVDDPRNERSVITDDRGSFTFGDLAVGRWRITAAKAGYVTHQFGQRRAFAPAPPVVLADRQQLQVAIGLARAGAINGRVYDEYGEPLAGARIQLLRPRMVRRQRYLQPVGNGDLSDDTGAFRLYGLAPGEYYVTASLRVAPLDSVVQTMYAPTFYPGTAHFAEAHRVFVAPGAEVHVTFPAAPVRAARITGFVRNSGGAPAGAFLNLVSEASELGVPFGFGGATREDGSFILADVPPGNYTLYAALRDGGLDAEVASLPLTVYGEDITGVTLATARPATMRVTLAADAGVSRSLPESVDLIARSVRGANETKHGSAARGTAQVVAVPPDPFLLELDVPDGWAVKSILVEDLDTADAPLDLNRRRDVPVRIVLTDRLTEVSGVVSVDRPDRIISVVIFPEDAGRWRSPSRYVRAAAVDERGAFRVTGLPGGVRYLAVAVDGLEEGQQDDPDFLARIKDRAISFPLAEGERRMLGLVVEEP